MGTSRRAWPQTARPTRTGGPGRQDTPALPGCCTVDFGRLGFCRRQRTDGGNQGPVDKRPLGRLEAAAGDHEGARPAAKTQGARVRAGARAAGPAGRTRQSVSRSGGLLCPWGFSRQRIQEWVARAPAPEKNLQSANPGGRARGAHLRHRNTSPTRSSAPSGARRHTSQNGKDASLRPQSTEEGAGRKRRAGPGTRHPCGAGDSGARPGARCTPRTSATCARCPGHAGILPESPEYQYPPAAPATDHQMEPGAQNVPAMRETRVGSLGREDSPGESNGNPLQCSGLENPMDTGAWRATAHGVTESPIRLSDYRFHSTRHGIPWAGLFPR